MPLIMNCAFMYDGPSLLKDTCLFIFNSFKSEVKLLNLTDVKTKKKMMGGKTSLKRCFRVLFLFLFLYSNYKILVWKKRLGLVFLSLISSQMPFANTYVPSKSINLACCKVQNGASWVRWEGAFKAEWRRVNAKLCLQCFHENVMSLYTLWYV